MFVHVGIDRRSSVLESLVLCNVLNSLHIHICLCIYRTYTESGEHVQYSTEMTKKNEVKEEVITKSDTKRFFKIFLTAEIANIVCFVVIIE